MSCKARNAARVAGAFNCIGDLSSVKGEVAVWVCSARHALTSGSGSARRQVRLEHSDRSAQPHLLTPSRLPTGCFLVDGLLFLNIIISTLPAHLRGVVGVMMDLVPARTLDQCGR